MRVNKGMKRMNRLPLSFVFIFWQNTIALNSYLALSTLCKNVSGLHDGLHIIWQARQLFGQTFWTQSENSLESLNFFASTKPVKHKTKRKDFSLYNLTEFVFEYFHDSRRILASFANFCFKSLFATWSHPAVTLGWYAPSRERFHLSPTHVLWHDKSPA